MARKLPKQGYYVYNYKKCRGEKNAAPTDITNKLDLSIVYCSGTTKGNFYWDPKSHSEKWNFLTWTCVPSVKDAENEHDYYEQNPIDVEVPKNKP
jgi:hypothetical protein